MKPEQFNQTCPQGTTTQDSTGPIRHVLGQLRDVTGVLSVEDYTRDPIATFGGSIGGHIRHCLDHIQAVIVGTQNDVIDYDHRERGTDIESDPAAATDEIERIDTALGALAEGVEGRTVTVKVMLTGDGDVTELQSTVGREFAFVLSHTIHHGAMIGGMVKALGGEVPEGFGLAPSTIAYRNR